MASTMNIKFYHVTALPATGTEGGIYFVEPATGGIGKLYIYGGGKFEQYTADVKSVSYAAATKTLTIVDAAGTTTTAVVATKADFEALNMTEAALNTASVSSGAITISTKKLTQTDGKVTNAAGDDIVIKAGDNITITQDDTTKEITIKGENGDYTEGTGIDISADNVISIDSAYVQKDSKSAALSTTNGLTTKAYVDETADSKIADKVSTLNSNGVIPLASMDAEGKVYTFETGIVETSGIVSKDTVTPEITLTLNKALTGDNKIATMDDIKGLSGVMHFKGTTANPTAVASAEVGDVYIISGAAAGATYKDGQEVVCTAVNSSGKPTAWEVLGDQNNAVTSITGNGTGNPAAKGAITIATSDTIDATTSANGLSLDLNSTIKGKINGAIQELTEGSHITITPVTSGDNTKLSISSDATKVEASTTNGKIKIDGAETTVYTHATVTAAEQASVSAGSGTGTTNKGAKVTINGIGDGASGVVSSTTTKTEFEIAGGSGVSVDYNSTNKKITVSADALTWETWAHQA